MEPASGSLSLFTHCTLHQSSTPRFSLGLHPSVSPPLLIPAITAASHGTGCRRGRAQISWRQVERLLEGAELSFEVVQEFICIDTLLRRTQNVRKTKGIAHFQEDGHARSSRADASTEKRLL